MSIYDQATLDMAARGRWLIDKLSERTLPDGRTVLELCEEPIWCKPDGTLRDYISAVDIAMAADEYRLTTDWDAPRSEA